MLLAIIDAFNAYNVSCFDVFFDIYGASVVNVVVVVDLDSAKDHFRT